MPVNTQGLAASIHIMPFPSHPRDNPVKSHHKNSVMC